MSQLPSANQAEPRAASPRPGPSLEPATYPHIWDLILKEVAGWSIWPRTDEQAVYDAYRALMFTCKTLQELLMTRLYKHVLVRGHEIFKWGQYDDDFKGNFEDEYKAEEHLRKELVRHRGGKRIPGLNWAGGEFKRQLCVERLKKYCKVVDDLISRKNKQQLALFNDALSNVTTVRLQYEHDDPLNLPHITTVAGILLINGGKLDFSGGDQPWLNWEAGYGANDEFGPPKDRTEYMPMTLLPKYVPPSTTTIMYTAFIDSYDWDHGNHNFVVKTDLGQLEHLTDLVFSFCMNDGLCDHRPNNHKPLGVIHSLVKSVAASVPRVRLTFMSLDEFATGWYCDAAIPDPVASPAGYAEYMRRYIARFLLWCNTNPGNPGETYFQWAKRTGNDDDTDSAIAPYLAAVAVETVTGHRSPRALMRSKEIYDVARRLLERHFNGKRDRHATYDKDYALETLSDNGDGEYDGGYGYDNEDEEEDEEEWDEDSEEGGFGDE
ncbi:hypothetical protein Q8F55_001470 [Vanrija albida]|uniref:SGNH hydrolase-type esterase domain-containing protein n=1 Tax=Vanrija albida TaxID=181172 RepID=A0ABR3QGA3_9TREE